MKRTQDAFHVSGHARCAFRTGRSRRSKSARHGDTLESCGVLHRTMYASPSPFEIISFCNPHPALVGLNRTLVWPYPYLDRSWDDSTRITRLHLV